MAQRSCVTQLANAVTLTASAVASVAAKVGGRHKHALYVSWDPVGNGSNDLVVTIEASPDGTNWFPVTGAFSATSGAATPGAQLTITYASDGTVAEYETPFYFELPADQIRIKYYESNTPENYGTVTAWLVSTN